MTMRPANNPDSKRLEKQYKQEATRQYGMRGTTAQFIPINPLIAAIGPLSTTGSRVIQLYLSEMIDYQPAASSPSTRSVRHFALPPAFRNSSSSTSMDR